MILSHGGVSAPGVSGPEGVPGPGAVRILLKCILVWFGSLKKCYFSFGLKGSNYIPHKAMTG